MNRRDFLKFLIATPIAAEFDIEKLLWIPGEKKIFLPPALPISLYGIPYHQSNGSTGQWLGFSRKSDSIVKEVIELVKKIQEHELRSNH